MGALIADVYGSTDSGLSFNSWTQAPYMPLQRVDRAPLPGGPAPPTFVLPPSGRISGAPHGPGVGQDRQFLLSDAQSTHTSMPGDQWAPATPGAAPHAGMQPYSPSNDPGIYGYLKSRFGSLTAPGPNWQRPHISEAAPPSLASEAYQTTALRLSAEGKDPNSWYERFSRWAQHAKGALGRPSGPDDAKAILQPCDAQNAVDGRRSQLLTLFFFIMVAVFVLAAIDSAFTAALNTIVSPMSRALRAMKEQLPAVPST